VDRETFEAKLRAEGYPQTQVNELAPHTRNAEHSHAFDVLALVLEGEITLTVGGAARTYRPGEEFSMPAGCRHVEDIGPQGVRYLVGRRAQ
jgi:quercetin dioxygenase-like cupin family protein